MLKTKLIIVAIITILLTSCGSTQHKINDSTYTRSTQPKINSQIGVNNDILSTYLDEFYRALERAELNITNVQNNPGNSYELYNSGLVLAAKPLLNSIRKASGLPNKERAAFAQSVFTTVMNTIHKNKGIRRQGFTVLKVLAIEFYPLDKSLYNYTSNSVDIWIRHEEGIISFKNATKLQNVEDIVYRKHNKQRGF